MRSLASGAIVAVVSSGALAAPAEPPSPAEVDAGIELALEVCVQCHGVGFEEESRHPGAPTFFEIAADPAVTELALRAFLRTPHVQMPDLRLTERETAAVIAYILSMREPPR